MNDEELMKQRTTQPDSEHLDLRSVNTAGEKQAELLRLFPEVGTEGGRLDFDKLRLDLGETVDVGKERYGMTWPGKADCFKTIQRPSLGTLRPIPGESVAFETTSNMVIEGDNLEVLKLLQKSYLGKVKMVYIDPPYNTGGDFIYPDDFSETLQTYLQYTGQVDDEGKKFGTNNDTDGRFHSKWLNMMFPRLYLARNLLSPEGVLVVHMDENEHDNLAKILKEIFGEDNLLGVAVWDKRNPKGDATGIAYQHESIFFFARNREAFVAAGGLQRTKRNAAAMLEKARQLFAQLGKAAVPADLQRCQSKYDLPASVLKGHEVAVDLAVINREFSDWVRAQEFSGGEAAYNKIDAEGEVYRLVSMAWPNKKKAPDDYFKPLIHPVTGKACPVPERGWRNPPATMAQLLKAGEIIFGEDHTTQPQRKYLLKNNVTETFASILAYGGSDDALMSSLGIPFENPKPVEVAKTLIGAATRNGGVVLDFFAGSGTAGHAVLELNAQDGMDRNFILVQLPEPTGRKDFPTVAEVTKERVRRAIKKMETARDGKLDLANGSRQDRGFRVFKLDESNFKPWDADVAHDPETLKKQLELHVDHVRKGRTSDDLLVEILLKSGFALTTPIERTELEGKAVFSVADGALFVCLEDKLTLELIRAMAAKKPERVVCLDQGFAGADQLKANAVQIFKAKGVTSFKTV